MNSLLWKFIRLGLCTGLGLLMFTESAWTGGFSIYEQGANATAMGSALVARPWDVTAAFYNPAGLAMYGKPGQWRFYGGIVPVQSMGRFTGMNPSPGAATRDKAVDKFFFPFHLHAAYQVNENMAVGLAITTPFGLGTEWDNKNNQYSGRFRSIQADIQSVFVTPSFSYKFNDNFSFGAGIDYVYAKVYLERNNPQTFFDGTNTNVYDVAKVKMDGTDNGSFGFNLGAYYKFDEKLSFGVHYKHKIKNDIKGTAKFSQINTGNAVIDNTVYASLHNPAFGGLSQDGNTTIEFPNMAVIGVAYKPIEKLSLELDYCWVGWKVFKEVVLEFPQNQLTPTSTLEEAYKNTFQIRFGVEYQAMDKLALRCGYIYDHTPAPTRTVNPLLPCADRNDIGLGLSYKFTEAICVDASYMTVMFKERSTEGKNVDGYNGIYNTHVNLFSLSVGYNFGGK
jgi:long-chain fatty acid transport protein